MKRKKKNYDPNRTKTDEDIPPGVVLQSWTSLLFCVRFWYWHCISRRLTCLFREISRGVQYCRSCECGEEAIWGKEKKREKEKKKRKEFLVFERKKKNVRRANSSSRHFKFQEIEDGLTEIEDVARWIIIRWWRGESHVTLIRVCFVYSRRVEREIEKTCIYSDWLIG